MGVCLAVALLTSVATLTGCGGNDGATIQQGDAGEPDGGPGPGPDPDQDAGSDAGSDAGEDGGPPQETVAKPEFSPLEGTFVGPRDVAITSTTKGAVIHYTVDGTNPDSTSPTYSAPINIAKPTNLKAFAEKAGSKDSAVRSGRYNIVIPEQYVKTVQFDPGTGQSVNDLSVRLFSQTADATLCYTVNGVAPSCRETADGAVCTSGSILYRQEIPVTANSTNIRAVGCKRGMHASFESRADYTLVADAPAFTPPPGSYDPANPVQVTLATKTKGGEIHYTINGSHPDCNSTQKFIETGTLGPFTTDSTVRAVTCKDKYATSAIITAPYLGANCAGSFDVTEPEQLEAISRCKTISGSLTVHGSKIRNLSPLGRLTSIGGDLWLEGTIATSLHGLEKLAAIGGRLSVLRNAGLSQIDALSSLQTVKGQLSISENALTEWIGPASLASVGGLSIREERKLQHLGGFAGLTEIAGALEIALNSSLSIIDGMPSLVSISSGARFEYNSALDHVAVLGKVLSVGGSVSIVSSPELTRFEAFALATTIRGAFTIEHAPKLTRLALENLGTIENALTLKGDMSALTSLEGLSGLTEAGYVFLQDGPFGFTNLHGLEHLTSVADTVSLTNAKGVESLVGLNGLKKAGLIRLYANPKLRSLRGLESLEKLTKPGGRGLSVESNYALTELGSLDALSSVAGDVGITNHPKLKQLNGLRALSKIDGGLFVIDDDILASLAELSALTSVGGHLSVINCRTLPHLDGLGLVQSIGDSLYIRNNQSLSRVDGLAQLTELAREFSVTDNPVLPKCQPTRIVDRLLANGYRGTVTIRNNGTGTCDAP